MAAAAAVAAVEQRVTARVALAVRAIAAQVESASARVVQVGRVGSSRLGVSEAARVEAAVWTLAEFP